MNDSGSTPITPLMCAGAGHLSPLARESVSSAQHSSARRLLPLPGFARLLHFGHLWTYMSSEPSTSSCCCSDSGAVPPRRRHVQNRHHSMKLSLGSVSQLTA